MLSRLVARDFRNFEQLDLSIPAEGLVVVGDNGHGKTNLLEAISYLSLVRSVRGARDSDVVRFGAPAFHIRAELLPVGADPTAHRSVGIGYERTGKRKKVTLDGVEQARLTAALGAVPSVGFSPADVSLVVGGPGERRRFLDIVLALTSPAYLQALQRYRAALLRRNAALRAGGGGGGGHRERDRNFSSNEEQVAIWEPMLAEHGGMIAALRHSFVQLHAERFSTLCESIGESGMAAMKYSASNLVADAEKDSSAAQAEGFRTAYEAQRPSEFRRGTTLVGPHRDELQLFLDGRDLRVFGSAGQQRTAAIALRLLEFATVRDALGRTPLLLLDDPFAELDSRRAARVLQLLGNSGIGQVMLAVPRREEIPDAFTLLERRQMVNGRIYRYGE